MQYLKQPLSTLLLATSLLLAALSSTAQQPTTQQPATQKLYVPNFDSSWVREQEPFRIAGNLYYVGSYDLTSYLITTPKGHILINTGIPGSDSMIRKHVEALGFKFSDIKILLATHA
ncbi:MAG TPA: hypothetical protein VKQ52_20460, partial [Puia sp.]|nr:hypothetical protein [Puia sp.]